MTTPDGAPQGPGNGPERPPQTPEQAQAEILARLDSLEQTNAAQATQLEEQGKELGDLRGQVAEAREFAQKVAGADSLDDAKASANDYLSNAPTQEHGAVAKQSRLKAGFARAKAALKRDKNTNSRALTPREAGAPRPAPSVAEEKKKRNGRRWLAVGALVAAVGGVAYAANAGGEERVNRDDVAAQVDKANANAATAKDKATGAIAANNGNGNGEPTRKELRAAFGSAGEKTALEEGIDTFTKLQEEKAHENAANDWKEAGTVNAATVEMYNGTDARLKQQIKEIFNEAPKENSNLQGMMAHMRSFDAQTMTKTDMIQGAAFASAAQDAYRSGLYQAVKGNPALTPTDASKAEMLNGIEAAFTHKDTKFENVRVSGLFLNHGINNESEDLFGQPLSAQNIRAVKVSLANGNVIYLKVGGGNDAAGVPCINILERMNTTAVDTPSIYTPSGSGEQPPVVTPPAGPEDSPSAGTENPPADEKPTTEPEDEPSTGEDQPEQGDKPKPNNEKHDDGVLPGNPDVPADQDPGTPDNPGTAPASPGTSPPSVPRPPKPVVPAPTPPSSETGNRPPAKEGTGPDVVDPKGSGSVPNTGNEDGGKGQAGDGDNI